MYETVTLANDNKDPKNNPKIGYRIQVCQVLFLVFSLFSMQFFFSVISPHYIVAIDAARNFRLHENDEQKANKNPDSCSITLV